MSVSDVPDPHTIVNLETVQRRGLATLVRAAPEAVGAELGIRCLENGSTIYIRCEHVPGLVFNRIQGFGVDGQAGSEQIATAEEWLKHSAPGAQLMVPPFQGGFSIFERLESQGLKEAQHSTVFILSGGCDLRTTPVDRIRVEAVPASQAALFGAVSAEGLGKPPKVAEWLAALVYQGGVTAYIAWINNEPVGTASLFVDGEYGWLFLASTRPRFRGLGAQTALLHRRVDDGRAQGVKVFSVEVLTPRLPAEKRYSSYRNCVRLGFEVAYGRSHFELR